MLAEENGVGHATVQRVWKNMAPSRLGGLEVDEQINFGRLLHGEVR
jgi:hypothetical protein